MLISDLINSIDNSLKQLSYKGRAKVWNDLFPEEVMSESVMKDLNGDATDEISSIIMDELEDSDAETIVNVFNFVCDNSISIDDLSNRFYEEDFLEEDIL